LKSKLICAAILTMAFAVPAAAEVSVFIGVAPPAVVYERPVPVPGPGFVWVEGYWVPVGHHYRWCRGHWERPPYESAIWVGPRYEREGHGWRYHRGYWRGHGHDHGHHYGWEHGHGHRHGHGRD